MATRPAKKGNGGGKRRAPVEKVRGNGGRRQQPPNILVLWGDARQKPAAFNLDRVLDQLTGGMSSH